MNVLQPALPRDRVFTIFVRVEANLIVENQHELIPDELSNLFFTRAFNTFVVFRVAADELYVELLRPGGVIIAVYRVIFLSNAQKLL